MAIFGHTNGIDGGTRTVTTWQKTAKCSTCHSLAPTGLRIYILYAGNNGDQLSGIAISWSCWSALIRQRRRACIKWSQSQMYAKSRHVSSGDVFTCRPINYSEVL